MLYAPGLQNVFFALFRWLVLACLQCMPFGLQQGWSFSMWSGRRKGFGRVGARGVVAVKTDHGSECPLPHTGSAQAVPLLGCLAQQGQHRPCGVTRVLSWADLWLVCCQGRVLQGMGCPGLAAYFTMGLYLRHPVAIRGLGKCWPGAWG